MQVTETLSDGLKRAFIVVLPSEAVETRRSERLAEIGKTLALPGFRPGKVPAIVVRQRFGPAITAEVVEESVQSAVQQVLDERGLRPAMQPSVGLINEDALATPGGARGLISDLEFKIDVEVLPEITLPDFAQIEVIRLKAEVADDVLDKALTNIARRARSLEDITDDELAGRGAEVGEIIVCDYVGRVDGEAFPGGTQADATIEVGGEGFIPGFTEQLVGVRPDDTRTIDVTFPADYGTKNLAGKAARFEISTKGIKRANQPAIDDAFAETLSFENLGELKDFVRGQIQREYDQLSRTRLKRELLDRLSELVSFALPPSMVETEFNQIWARVEADRKAGSLDDDDKGKDEDTLRAEYRAIAERRVRLGLLLAEVGRINNVGITQEELTRAMRAEAANYPGQETQILDFFRKNPRAADGLRGPIFEEKAMDVVIAKANVTDRAVTPEELAAVAEEGQTPSAAEPAAEPAPLAGEATEGSEEPAPSTGLSAT